MVKTRQNRNQTSKNQQLSMLLFADNQVITADTEDNIQKAAYKLNQIITEYGFKISVQEKKINGI